MSNYSKLQRDDLDGQGKFARDHGAIDMQGLLKESNWRNATWEKDAADAAAATVTAERCFYRSDTYERRLQAVRFIPNAALTADAANYATLRVRKRLATGADGGIVAEETTQLVGGGGSGNWVAHVPVSLQFQGLDSLRDLKAGEMLTIEVLKAGTGVVVPAGLLDVVFE